MLDSGIIKSIGDVKNAIYLVKSIVSGSYVLSLVKDNDAEVSVSILSVELGVSSGVLAGVPGENGIVNVAYTCAGKEAVCSLCRPER